MGEARGWFAIEGRQEGERTLAEQLIGLDPALAAARGKRYLDLGCSEGLISLQFAMAGAALVHGVECNQTMVGVARHLFGDNPGLAVMMGDLNDGLPATCLPQYDVVLMLAILRKLHYPEASLRKFSAVARESVVIRLPRGSSGFFRSKFNRESRCDTNKVMPDCGFALGQTLDGPRGELVQYWERRPSV